MKRLIKTLMTLAGGVICATGWAGELHYAAASGNVAKMKLLLANNPKLANENCEDFGSPLHQAIRFGKKEAATFLLLNKADANARDTSGFAPLHWVSIDGLHRDIGKELVELLLTHNADINVKSRAGGGTPLHLAVSEENFVVAETLLAHKADVNARDNYGERPLDRATRNAGLNPKMVELLRKYGAMKGAGAIHRAVDFGDAAEVKRLLAEQPDVVNEKSPRTKEGVMPIQVAVIARHNEILELLLARNADVNAKDDIGLTALHWAARWRNKGAARLLLANKADVNAKDNYGHTPVDAAEQNQNTEIAALLRSHGGKSGKELGGAGPAQTK
ncbi:MAG: ankyrin repeat domain-containing protein [Verrucomicrobia bacterium]|nr:ankyrin repeat domain-containing protein [Verrucomicrobiota bacterium]